MHGIVSRTGLAATDCPAVDGNDGSSTAANGSYDIGWFPKVARAVLGKDAGLHLHYITGYPERSCYYYASGERVPPSDFLRRLFHSEQGEPFFLAYMEGCKAKWWLGHLRDKSDADKARAFVKGF